MKSTPACSSASLSVQLFSHSPQHRGRIPQCSGWVQAAYLVFVHVEVRVCHVCCARVLRRLETQVVDDSSCARSRAWRGCIIHRLVTVGFSCDESYADSVLSVVNVPACRRSLLREINLQVHGFAHSKLCESARLFQLGLHRLFRFRVGS